MNLDLPPHEWKSDRDQPKEPIFGPGLVPFLYWFGSFVLTLSLLHYFR